MLNDNWPFSIFIESESLHFPIYMHAYTHTLETLMIPQAEILKAEFLLKALISILRNYKLIIIHYN